MKPKQNLPFLFILSFTLLISFNAKSVSIFSLTFNKDNDRQYCPDDPVDTYATIDIEACGSYTVPSGDATYLSSGTVTDVIPNACGADSIITINLIVNPLPIVDAGPDIIICDGEAVTLYASGADSYAWADGTAGPEITVVPTESGSYTVIGFDENGCFDTDAVMVIIEEDPIVDAGPDITICLGETVVLSGSGAGPGGDYLWEPGGIPDGGEVSPIETTTYTVTGVTENGCTNIDELTIFVNDLPVFDAGPDQTICEGDPVTLDFPAAPILDYEWSDDVVAGEAFYPTESGAYILTGINEDPCINTDTVIITVNPMPLIDAGPDQSLCLGESFILNATGLDMDGTYTWIDGLSNGTEITPVDPGTYTYYVTGTNGIGCSVEDTLEIVINPIPEIDAGPDAGICIGDEIILAGSGAGLGGIYIWDPADVTDGEPFSPIATAIYTVFGTDANGCSDTDEVAITVNPLPIIFAGIDDTVCEGTFITFEAAGAGIDGAYLWYPADVIDGVPYAVESTTTFTVTGTDENGCSSTDELIINVDPAPPVNAGSDQEICLGDSLFLSAEDIDPALIYEWSDGLEDGDFISPVLTTTYTLTAINELGCSSEDEVTIIVNSLPIIDAGPDITICDSGEAILTASGAGMGGSYIWDGGIINGVPFIPDSTTIYNVTGTDANGCVNSDETIVYLFELPEINAGLDTAICYGEPIVLLGAGAGLLGTYAWSGGVINGEAFTPITTMTYIVTGTDENGCENTDEMEVVINTLPDIYAGEDTTICLFEEVLLFGEGAGPDGSYVWSGGVIDSVSFVPAASNIYMVTGTDANGCSNTDNVMVTVNPAPVLDAGPDITACVGEEVVIEATVAGIGITIAWDGDVLDGVPFDAEETGTYTVTATDLNGCVSTDYMNVFVFDAVTVNAGPDISICEGESVTLYALDVDPAVTYAWSDSITDGIAFEPAETGEYILTGSTLDGCVSSDYVVVTVHENPIISGGSDRVICHGEVITLEGTGAGIGGVYDWSGGVLNGESFVPEVSGTYVVTGIDVNGCYSVDTIIVTVNDLPSINFSADSLFGCVPHPVRFEAFTDSGIIFEWDFGDGTTGSGSSVSHVYLEAGLYDVRLNVINAFGCENSLLFDDYIAAGDGPVAAFEHNGDKADAVHSLIDFKNLSINSDSYFWEFDILGTSEDEHPSFAFDSGDDLNYEITLMAINSYGCSDTAVAFLQLDDALVYYVPNAFTPTANNYNLIFKPKFATGLDIMNYHLTIFNRWGEVIFESYNQDIGWDGRYGNRDFVEQGVYLWRLEYGVTYTDEMFSDEGHVTVLR